METVTITMKNPPALYLEADNVSPDAFAGKTAARLPNFLFMRETQHPPLVNISK